MGYSPSRNVIGYFPSWTGSVDRIRFDRLTHVNYSFALPTSGGGLSPVDHDRLRELSLRARAHGVKACIAVGGWNDGDTSAFEAMAADRSARGRFLGNLLDFCARYALDGVDIDWEYPKAHSAADYALMMKELGQALHAQGKLLTTCAIAMDDEYGAHIHPDVFGYVDFVNIMAYDWHGISHSSYDVAERSLDYWLRRGCPPEKAMLGLPFYGRKPPAAYRDLVIQDPEAPYKDHVGEVYYNGIPTIRKKTELAMRKGGGVLIWEITQDTDGENSLLGAISAVKESFTGRPALKA